MNLSDVSKPYGFGRPALEKYTHRKGRLCLFFSSKLAQRRFRRGCLCSATHCAALIWSYRAHVTARFSCAKGVCTDVIRGAAILNVRAFAKKKKNAVRTLRDIRMATWMTIDAQTARTAACSNRSPKWRGDSVAPLRITAQCIPFRAQYERCGPRLQFRPAPRGCLRILFVAELRSWTFRTSHLLCICVCSACAREIWHHTQWFNNLNILYFLLSKSISWHTWAHTHK